MLYAYDVLGPIDETLPVKINGSTILVILKYLSISKTVDFLTFVPIALSV